MQASQIVFETKEQSLNIELKNLKSYFTCGRRYIWIKPSKVILENCSQFFWRVISMATIVVPLFKLYLLFQVKRELSEINKYKLNLVQETPAAIKSFSSYTKGLHEVLNVSSTEQSSEITLRFPLTFQVKLDKRTVKFNCAAISVDGVFAEISSSTKRKQYFEVIAKVAREVFLKSTLCKLKPGNKVNIGMLSTNPKKWLLDGSPLGIVKLISSGIAEGHQHTKEFTFECSRELFERIQKFEYIGLNASGLLVKNPCQSLDRYYFSIHAGKATRDATMLGYKDLAIGTEFTLTLPM